MTAEIIYLAKRAPETQVRLAAKNIGLVVKKFEGGFLLRAQDGEILPGHYGFDEEGRIDTCFGELVPWTAEQIVEHCTKFAEEMKTGVHC